jgi:hypothetical protein
VLDGIIPIYQILSIHNGMDPNDSNCQCDVTVAVNEISCLFYQATAQILMSVKARKPVFMELVLIPRENSSASVLLIMSL